MTQLTKDTIDYITACVSEFAKKYLLSSQQAYGYLRRFNAIDFIIKHYNIMHTLSLDDVVLDLQSYCYKNGGKVA